MSDSEKTRKTYVFPHRHCPYCGKMIDIKGRAYCLKCKPEFDKEQSKTNRSKKMQKFFLIYIVLISVMLAVVFFFLNR